MPSCEGGIIFVFTKGAASSSNLVQYQITGNMLVIKFPPAVIGNANNFKYVVLTRKYDDTNPQAVKLLGSDKMPNQGHFTSPN